MAKYKFIPIDIYKRQVDVFVGNKLDFISFIETKYPKDSPYQNMLDEIRNQDDSSIDAAHWFNKIYGNGIIQLKQIPTTPKETAVCAHEVLHSVFDILAFVNVEFVYGEANEAYTYLFEYIMSELLDFDTYKTL